MKIKLELGGSVKCEITNLLYCSVYNSIRCITDDLIITSVRGPVWFSVGIVVNNSMVRL